MIVEPDGQDDEMEIDTRNDAADRTLTDVNVDDGDQVQVRAKKQTAMRTNLDPPTMLLLRLRPRASSTCYVLVLFPSKTLSHRTKATPNTQDIIRAKTWVVLPQLCVSQDYRRYSYVWCNTIRIGEGSSASMSSATAIRVGYSRAASSRGPRDPAVI